MIAETRLFETAPCRCYNHDMDIETAKEFIPFFDSFSEETRKKILSSVTATAFRKGETVHSLSLSVSTLFSFYIFAVSS